MKIPEPAPKIKDILVQLGEKAFTILNNIPADTAKKWQDAYDYWSEFKYKNFPEGITPEIAWLKRSFDTYSQRIQAPVFDKNHNFFSFWVSPLAQKIMYTVDRSIGSVQPLQDLRDDDENGRYLMASLIEEASNSSIIEGAATTRRQAKELIASNRKPSNKSEWMVINNFEAIKYIKTVTRQPLTLDLICKIHSIITEHTLAKPEEIGCFRTSPKDDDIVIEDGEQNVLYRTPPGKEVIPRLEELIRFINQEDGQTFIHPIIKAIILHFTISYIHPFTDGNGRTARALFYWYMLKNDYWLFEYISISRLVLKMHGQYNRAFLYSEYSDNDLTYFINFHLEVIDKALKEFQEYLHRKKVDFQNAEPLFKKWPTLNKRQKDLLINALKNPQREYTIARHSVLHNITWPTGRADFLNLVRLGLFSKQKQGKGYIFLPVDNLKEVLITRK